MITQAQEDAIDKIEDIMREHFFAGVFAVVVDGETDRDKDTIKVGWHGGFATALGLCVMAERRLQGDSDGGETRE